MNIGLVIMNKRKALGYTQQVLADKLHVSSQAVSKWENGTACPEVDLLPAIATILGTSVDALLGYRSPVKPLKVLDIGCGEGKDAVFLAKNGYIVSAFDVADSGIEKGKQLAEKCGTYVDFFKADISDFRLTEKYDIIFSSGVFHYITADLRGEIAENLKAHTSESGLHAINVFVNKPFIKRAPDLEKNEDIRFPWKSGELFTHYHDWRFQKMEEIIFDCNSGGKPHQHCMDVMIAEKI